MLKHHNLRLLGAALAATAINLASPPGARAQAEGPPPDSAVYVVDPSSLLLVHAGKSGLLKGFGHEHRVRAHAFEGTAVYFPGDVGRSRAWVTVLTDSLRVVPEADSADIPQITRTMRERTLRVDSSPKIAFVSRMVEPLPPPPTAPPGSGERLAVRLSGDLTIAGRTRPVRLDLEIDLTPDTLRAEGTFTVKQTDFGIKPYRTALGLVKVKNEVRFELRVVATDASAER